jgi:hypothetical protein
VFSGTDSPISKSEFKSGTHLCISGISGISEIPPEKPCFHKKPLCSKVQGISEKFRFQEDFGDLGDTLHIVKKFPENFGKTGIQVDTLHFFFSGAFRVSRVQRCEKVKNPKPK